MIWTDRLSPGGSLSAWQPVTPPCVLPPPTQVLAMQHALSVAILLLTGFSTASPTPADLEAEAQAAHCGGGPCRHHPFLTRVDVRRSLLGAGAHRTLESWAAVVCNSGPGGAANTAAAASCELALLQPLPPALFADPYELEGAARTGAGPVTRLFGPVDVESIEARSQATLLATYVPLTLFPQQVSWGGVLLF